MSQPAGYTITDQTYIRYFNNLVPASQNVYGSGGFNISLSNFNSIHTGNVSVSQGTWVSTENNPNSATDSVFMIRTASKSMLLTHSFEIQPYMQPEYVGGIPAHFDAFECLKYIFKIEVYEDEFGDKLDDTDDTDLSSYFENHDTGGWDEVYNNRSPKYLTNSFSGQLDASTDSTFYFYIASTETFTDDTDVIVHMQEVTDLFPNGIIPDTKKRRITLKANNTIQSIAGVAEAVATRTGGVIEVRITVFAGSPYDTNIGLWCAIYKCCI
jgi:hypothetical protein